MPEASPFDEAAQERLQRDTLLQGLRPEQVDAVMKAARQHRVERGSFLFHQGDAATILYLLVSGRMRFLQVTPDGQQVLLRIITSGEVFGDIALLDGAAYQASARAVEDCTALAWDRAGLTQLMEQYPRLAMNALRLLAGRIQNLQDRFRELATERVERRVARALVRLTRQAGRRVEGGVLIDFPLSREDLAEMTGATLFTVSRILSAWERGGLIETGRQRVLIRSPHGLVAIAEDLPAAGAEDEA